jgi:hypothetical protein
MLLRRLADSMSSEVVGFMTQPFTLVLLLLLSLPLRDKLPLLLQVLVMVSLFWWLFLYDSSFCSSFFSASLLSPSHCSSADGSPLSVAGHDTLCFDYFHLPDVLCSRFDHATYVWWIDY